MVPDALEVEHDAGDDQRPRERPAAGLVGTGDVAAALLAIEGEELAAGSLHHVAEDSHARGERPLLSQSWHEVVAKCGPSCRKAPD